MLDLCYWVLSADLRVRFESGYYNTSEEASKHNAPFKIWIDMFRDRRRWREKGETVRRQVKASVWVWIVLSVNVQFVSKCVCVSQAKALETEVLLLFGFCRWWREQATHLRWDTLIISMGGSSFPRSPLNAKHLPGKHNRDTDRRVWGRGGDAGRQKTVPFLTTCEETDWTHSTLVPGRPGFISFAGAGKEENGTNSFSPPALITAFHSHAGHSTHRSSASRCPPLNKTRTPFRCILSRLPKEVLIWFCRGHLGRWPA